MSSPPPAGRAPTTAATLETVLGAVEHRLAALGEALRELDPARIDRHATELHGALAVAVEHFVHAARSGGVPAALRRRLADTTGQVAAQRESLARATAALDRAIDVLMPRESAGLYSALGNARRGARGASVIA